MSTDSRLTTHDVAREASWFKSSYSSDNGIGSCVSVAALGDRVGIRDSKQQNGPTFVAPTAAWSSFIREVKSGRWAT